MGAKRALHDGQRYDSSAHRPQEVSVPLEDATLDDMAFAIVGIEAQVAQARRGLSGLRELYEHPEFRTRDQPE